MVWFTKFFLVVLLLFILERFLRFLLPVEQVLVNQKVFYGQIDIPYFMGVGLGILVLCVLVGLHKLPPIIQLNKYWPVLPLILTGVGLNLYDCWSLGGVGDYLWFSGLWFNVADAYIVTGFILIVSIHIHILISLGKD